MRPPRRASVPRRPLAPLRRAAARGADPPPARRGARSRAARIACVLATASAFALAVSSPRVTAAPAASAATAAPAAPAKRVVSLNPSLTAILLALGARDALVGVDSFSQRQEPATAGAPHGRRALQPERRGGRRPRAGPRRVRAERGAARLPAHARRARAPRARSRSRQLRGRARGDRDARRARRARGRGEGADRRHPRRARARSRRRAAGRPRPRDGARPAARPALRRRPRELRRRDARERRRREPGAGVRTSPIRASPASGSSPPRRSSCSTPRRRAIAGAARRYWARWGSLPAVRAGRVVALAPGAVTLPGPWLDRALALLEGAVRGEAPRAAEAGGAGRSGVGHPASGPDAGAVVSPGRPRRAARRGPRRLLRAAGRDARRHAGAGRRRRGCARAAPRRGARARARGRAERARAGRRRERADRRASTAPRRTSCCASGCRGRCSPRSSAPPSPPPGRSSRRCSATRSPIPTCSASRAAPRSAASWRSRRAARLGLGYAAVPPASFAGALATLLLLFAVAGGRGRLSPTTLLLTGVVFNAFASAAIVFLASSAGLTEGASIFLWLIGNLSEGALRGGGLRRGLPRRSGSPARCPSRGR